MQNEEQWGPKGKLLSESLAGLLTDPCDGDRLTLNRLLDRTHGRGLYLVIILLCLPFLIPVSLPGLSSVLGTIIAIIALGLAAGKPPRLPRFLGERELPAKVRQRALIGSIRFLRLVE